MICSLLLLQRPLQRALHLAIPIDWVPKPRSTLPELVAPRLRDRAERRSSRLRGSRRPPPSSRPRRRRPTPPSQRQQLRLRLDERDAVADGRCAALHRAQQRVDERLVLAQDRARLSERPQRARVVRLGRLCSARRGAPAGGPKRKGRGAGGRRSSASATSASRRRHLRATAGGVDGTRRVPRASALTRRALARPLSP